jgi:hypothetical protein
LYTDVLGRVVFREDVHTSIAHRLKMKINIMNKTEKETYFWYTPEFWLGSLQKQQNNLK